MKIYGVTFIDDNDDCTSRSETQLFKTKEEQLAWAWERFNKEYEYDKNEDRLDTDISEPLNKEGFMIRMANCGYDYYTRWDSSYQVELFEQEI